MMIDESEVSSTSRSGGGLIRGYPHRIFALIVLSLVVVALLWFGGRLALEGLRYYEVRRGQEINREAWEAGFVERGLSIPASGPRDGYWGARLGAQKKHPVLGWVLPKVEVPGLLQIDELGMQQVPSAVADAPRVLITGGSTAFGAYASGIEHTYFAVLSRILDENSTPASMIVYAAGAWKSEQEVSALSLNGLAQDPDVVVFLDGLNDVTNGSNARTRFGVKTETLDGSEWHLLYHERDYEDRVRVYVENMRNVRDLLLSKGIDVIFALQPALFEKRHQSQIERELEALSLAPLGSREELVAVYSKIRMQLARLSDVEGAYFIDCSRAFDNERFTVFTDMWHFSDPGHRMLAEKLAPILSEILGRKT